MRVYPELSQDEEFETLRAAGYTGSLNDKQFKFLRDSGYDGALTEMITAYINNPELLINGTFDTDTDWTKQAGWAITGGKATKTPGSTSNLISVADTVEAGVSYTVTFDVLDYAAGYIILYCGLGGTGNATTTITANGSYEFTLNGGTTDQKIYVQGSNTFDGSVDNISIKRA